MNHVSLKDFNSHRVPHFALTGAALLIAFTLTVAGLARLAGPSSTGDEGAPATESRILRFEDRDDGAVVVIDETDHTTSVASPGTNGFLRGVLRGLARERRQHAIGSEPPFRLTRHADNGLTLEDVATGRRIDLDAFGPTNAGAFARFLKHEEQRP